MAPNSQNSNIYSLCFAETWNFEERHVIDYQIYHVITLENTLLKIPLHRLRSCLLSSKSASGLAQTAKYWVVKIKEKKPTKRPKKLFYGKNLSEITVSKCPRHTSRSLRDLQVSNVAHVYDALTDRRHPSWDHHHDQPHCCYHYYWHWETQPDLQAAGFEEPGLLCLYISLCSQCLIFSSSCAGSPRSANRRSEEPGQVFV